MKSFHLVSVLLVIVSLDAVQGEVIENKEIQVSATTESIALFKNGYTVVRQEIAVPEPGLYRWEDVPPVIHGTFFIESDLDLEIRTTQRLISLPIDADNPPRSPADCVGKLVNVHFHTPLGEKDKTVTGRILDASSPTATNSLLPELTRQPPYRYDPFSSRYPIANSPTPGSPVPAPAYVLESPDGSRYHFLTGQQITRIELIEPVKERLERRPVMLFHVTKNQNAENTGGNIRLFYLTKGATWAPSYQVDLLDGKRLRIEQAAAIRNEWSPIQQTDLLLVSGFPQIECSQILSPLNPVQTLERFFQQIAASYQQARFRDRSGNDLSFTGNMMTQQAIHPAATANAGFDTTELAAGEGPDIHYNSIGKRTLDVGDTLSVSVGKGEADYRRILECDTIPLILNSYDRYRYNWRNQSAADRVLSPEVFDVLKFPNPLEFPMTTAPATVTEKGRFLGQSQSNWVNPGQVASVKITKVMNVRVTYAEQAQDVIPQVIQRFRDHNYIKRTVTGTFEIVNQRGEEITLHLNGVMLGKAERIEPEPTDQKTSSRDVWPNDLTDLFWELNLKPGEKKTVTVSGTRWFYN